MNKLVLTSNDSNLVTQVQLFAQANGLALEVTNSNVVAFPTTKPVQSIASVESDAIRTAITAHKGNLSEAAKTLGIGRATLYRKVKEYQINTKEYRNAA